MLVYSYGYIPSDCKTVWLLSSVPLSSSPAAGAASASVVSHPIFLVAWRFSPLSPVALPRLLQDTCFCVRGLGFHGLTSGCVNCSDRRWRWLGRRRRQPGDGAFPHRLGKTREAEALELHSSVQAVRAEEPWPWGQYPIPTAQSHSSVFYLRRTAMLLHFVVLPQGTVT